jgi:hypothetical protein
MLPVSIVLAYVALLVLSGLTMFVLAGVGFRQGVGARVIEALLGAGLLAYAVYLLFFFGGGKITFSFWVLLGPILGIISAVRARRGAQVQQEQLAATYAAEARDRERQPTDG